MSPDLLTFLSELRLCHSATEHVHCLSILGRLGHLHQALLHEQAEAEGQDEEDHQDVPRPGAEQGQEQD